MADSTQDRYDVAAIGTGPAGHQAAIQAAKADRRVVVIDRSPQVGGEAVLRGTIPSKSLREAVNYLAGVKQEAFYGRSYRAIDRFTMANLMARTAQVIRSEVDVVRDTLLRNGVEIVTGTARFLDPHTLVVQGTERREIRADKIMI
ncbi:MAG: FAD-dependent oxidoreductase, partial [Proteobacteria bacterium]|nr:FAD-dependent oxidoreductase [Pseudomonadota bacterium]